ncbi:hypothetical protein TWF192_005031 [Orbilia oligospora]|uniref:Uncharacterized protein n=2 Tax=Orbilia oligospora TaxID=2813651 RepID=A0A6G1M9M7_ORBOL|nr:hypothetical protein TWF191_009639 [Orbilia oligospora]KAF3251053.1 hypothetical protein TWF192_005031 [Orbilia oligospora]
MTAFAVRPLRPALSLPPTLCNNSQSRSAPTKLSLFIPSSIDTSAQNAPSPSCRTFGTPIAVKKPKLSLSFGNDTRKTFSSSNSLKLSCSPSSDDESTASQEDITSRNTAVNTHIGSGSCNPFGSCRWTRTYSYTEVHGKRSILKGSPSHSQSNSPACETMSRSVTFQSEHTVIPSPSEEEEDYEFVPSRHELEDIDNMSPPSTTSSSDSEESESDSEPKTPVDDEDTRGRCVDRFASALSRSGKWKRSKREWVWTLGGSDSNDIMQELEYSSASLMQVEAI